MSHGTVSRRRLLGASAAAAAAFGQSRPAPLRLPRKVRIAMLGFDGHPSLILGELPRLPDVEVAAIYDPDPRRLASEGRKALLVHRPDSSL